jgi:hypothetical protein
LARPDVALEIGLVHGLEAEKIYLPMNTGLLIALICTSVYFIDEISEIMEILKPEAR